MEDQFEGDMSQQWGRFRPLLGEEDRGGHPCARAGTLPYLLSQLDFASLHRRQVYGLFMFTQCIQKFSEVRDLQCLAARLKYNFRAMSIRLESTGLVTPTEPTQNSGIVSHVDILSTPQSVPREARQTLLAIIARCKLDGRLIDFDPPLPRR